LCFWGFAGVISGVGKEGWLIGYFLVGGWLGLLDAILEAHDLQDLGPQGVAVEFALGHGCRTRGTSTLSGPAPVRISRLGNRPLRTARRRPSPPAPNAARYFLDLQFHGRLQQLLRPLPDDNIQQTVPFIFGSLRENYRLIFIHRRSFLSALGRRRVPTDRVGFSLPRQTHLRSFS